MDPKMVTRDAFTVMGLMECFTHNAEDFEGIWKRFMAYQDQIQPLSTDKAYYGVGFGTEESSKIEYLAGMAVGDVDSLPQGLVLRDVPAARYAVFQCTVKTIHQTYDYIFDEWFPSSPYEHDEPKPLFEHYPPDTATAESPVFLHVPIRLKGESDETA